MLPHLKSYDINLNEVLIKTDNETEYDGETHHYRPQGFHETIERTGVRHFFNPPARPNFKADVASVHATIANECYEAAMFATRTGFLLKSATYQLWYNVARKNSYRGWKVSLEIQKQRNPP